MDWCGPQSHATTLLKWCSCSSLSGLQEYLCCYQIKPAINATVLCAGGQINNDDSANDVKVVDLTKVVRQKPYTGPPSGA